MSFRCQKCGQAMPDHSKPVMVATASRLVNYSPVFEDNKMVGKPGQGYETVTEIMICKACALLSENGGFDG